MRSFLKDYFFKGISEYAFKPCGNYVLEHRWNGNTKNWEVAIYTAESFKNMQNGKAKYYGGDRQKSELQLQYQHLSDL